MSSDPASGPLFLEASYLTALGWIAWSHLAVTDKQYSHSMAPRLWFQWYSSRDKNWNVPVSFNVILSSSYRRCRLRFSLTSGQADGSAAMPLHVVFRADVDVLLAQPPQAEVGRLAGLIDFIHPWAEHCPVVRYHRREHASHTHQQHEDGNLYLCALVHVCRWWDFC